MAKVNTRSLRSLASKVKPSILTGAITESADYIDELEKENKEMKEFIQWAVDVSLDKRILEQGKKLLEKKRP